MINAYAISCLFKHGLSYLYGSNEVTMKSVWS